VRLQGSKDSEHKMGDISFIMYPMATKFLRSVCKYINDIHAKGFITGFAQSMGNAVVIGSSAAGHDDSRA